MHQSLKIKNKTTVYSPFIKPRVGDVVSVNGNYFTNTSGINSAVENLNNWFPNSEKKSTIDILLLASDVKGTDPDFYIDLTSSNPPDFPKILMVYVDLLGDSIFQKQDPVNYIPGSKQIKNMNSPIDFPNQKIRIILE